MRYVVQFNLINSKSLGLEEILLRSIEILNYRLVDIELYPKIDYTQFFLSIKHKFWARKRNVLMRPEHMLL